MGLLLFDSAKPPMAPDLVGPAAHGLVHTFAAFWPLWLLIVAVALVKLVWRVYQLRRLSRSGIAEIDGMDGRTFEVYLSTLFRRLGYGVEVTRLRGDYGADLVLTKGKQRTAVQAKRWSKRIGVKAVQEAVAARGYYRCDAALVVANREFTQQARRLAQANQVELWNREMLVSKLLTVHGVDVPPGQFALKPAPTVNSPATAVKAKPVAASETVPPPGGTAADLPPAGAKCVTCGVTVSEKVRDYCLAHTARFGGRIYCFHHQRGVHAAPVTD